MGIFQPDRKESAYLEKMTKSKAAKKWVWKVVFRSFGKRRIRSQPLGPLEEEGQLGSSGEGTSKRENSEKIRKGPVTHVADTTLVLVPRTANGENKWYTKKP